MSQVLLRPDQIQGDSFELDGKEAHHVARVLRKKEGDKLSLFDGQGGQFQGVLTQITSDRVRGQLVRIALNEKKTIRLRLFQGVPKGAKIDYVIEKATELGADEIIPFLSQKSLIKLDASQAASKQKRWEKLAQAASKQCDRSTVPVVHAPVSLKALESEVTNGKSLLFVKDGEMLSAAMNYREAIINLIVGPESGFTKSEVDWLVGLGAKPVSLGELTLRTETAGLAALAIVNYELSRL